MNKSQKYISHSPAETFALGQEIAVSLKGGEVLALSGDLGVGKTAFVQGLAAGLGVKGVVNSPTFTIMKLYQIKKSQIKQLCHIDAYRLQSSEDLVALGVSDYFGAKDTVSAVEWAERVGELLLKYKVIKIFLSHLEKDSREIIVE